MHWCCPLTVPCRPIRPTIAGELRPYDKGAGGYLLGPDDRPDALDYNVERSMAPPMPKKRRKAIQLTLANRPARHTKSDPPAGGSADWVECYAIGGLRR